MIDNFKKTRNIIISKTHFISSHLMEAAGRSRGCPCRLCLDWRMMRFALSCPAIRNVQACGLLVKW